MTPKPICDGMGESEGVGVGDSAGAIGVKSLVCEGGLRTRTHRWGGWMLPVVEVVQ